MGDVIDIDAARAAGAARGGKVPKQPLAPMTDVEVDAMAARPMELMNGREADYYRTFLHLKSGKRPDDPRNQRKWQNRNMKVTVSSICAELGGAERGPIGFEQATYRWIWYLVQREKDTIVEPEWSPGEIGPRGLAASLQASRSLLADQMAKTENFRVKAEAYDELVEQFPKFGLNRRGGKAKAATVI